MKLIYLYSCGNDTYPLQEIAVYMLYDEQYQIIYEQICLDSKYVDITSNYNIKSKIYEHIEDHTNSFVMYKTIIKMIVTSSLNPAPEKLFKYLEEKNI